MYFFTTIYDSDFKMIL